MPTFLFAGSGGAGIDGTLSAALTALTNLLILKILTILKVVLLMMLPLISSAGVTVPSISAPSDGTEVFIDDGPVTSD